MVLVQRMMKKEEVLVLREKEVVAGCSTVRGLEGEVPSVWLQQEQTKQRMTLRRGKEGPRLREKRKKRKKKKEHRD